MTDKRMEYREGQQAFFNGYNEVDVAKFYPEGSQQANDWLQGMTDARRTQETLGVPREALKPNVTIFTCGAAKGHVHEFTGWAELKDETGRIVGGTAVCGCGMTAIEHSMWMGDDDVEMEPFKKAEEDWLEGRRNG